MRAIARSSILIGVVLALAACSSGGPGQGTAAPDPTDGPQATVEPTSQPVEQPLQPGTALDACELITASDVAAATGIASVPAGEFKSNPDTLSPGHSKCTYRGDFGQIIVDLTPEDGANLYDAARGAYDDASDITGAWDGAFNSNQHHRAFVWKGAVTTMFTLFLTDPAVKQYDVAEQLGKAMVGKL
jgi:hypothetical protein